MTVEVGALEQAYAKVEASYAADYATGGTALAATDGIRHLELAINTKLNREPSPEKRGTPDQSQSLPRRRSSTWNLSSIMWEPSGTLGTPANVGKFLKAGMGAQTAPTLTTTVASGPSATGATLTSGTGLAIGDIIIVEMPDGTFEATRLKTVNTGTGAATWDELSAAPDVGADVWSGVNYKLASNITESLSIYKYYNAGGYEQAVFGSVVDQIQVTFDGTTEALLALQGPGGVYADSDFGTVQAKPASHTTVGSPVGGMVGTFLVGATAFPVLSVVLNINNQILLRNAELGTSQASGILGRANLREVTVQVTFYLEDRNLMAKANAITQAVLRCMTGSTVGSRLALVAPKVEFEFPDIGNEIGPKEVTIEGRCYATDGNDQVFLAEA